jgi:transforming growth factor-beta-induced protein
MLNNKNMKTQLLLLLVFFSFRLSSQTITDIVVNSPVHNTLEAAVIAAGLAPALSAPGSLTVFAPTDDAFATLPAGTVAALLADPQGALTKVLTYHVVSGKIQAAAISNNQIITTLNGKTVRARISNGSLFINNAKITVKNIKATNGIVHVIDAVLIPPTTVMDIIANSTVHNTLETAIGAAKLTKTLDGKGPFTVFAPTDAAFANLPAGVVSSLLADPKGALTRILTYHVVAANAGSSSLSNNDYVTTVNGKQVVVKISNGSISINNANVTIKDINTDNGVVHVIDAVLLPPSTVVDVVVNSPILNTLKTAVIGANLASTLSGKGPFTVFAPTDRAFEALPDGLLDALISDVPALQSILSYHVVSANASASSLTSGKFVTTVNGKSVVAKIDGGSLYINNSKVTVRDIKADNGIVHIIDAVLLPPSTVKDIVVASPTHKTLVAALGATGLTSALEGKGPFTVFAPTDRAFNLLPKGTVEALLNDLPALTNILTYHVASGEIKSGDINDKQFIATLNGASVQAKKTHTGLLINNARVIVSNIIADNGIVHVIDVVLLPPPTVADIIINSPDHTLLETAVIKAELVGALKGQGPFTVFAPTDKAFKAIPASTLNSILSNKTLLQSILTYHVVAGAASKSDLKDGQFIKTLNGKSVNVKFDKGNVFIDNALVQITDLKAGNGIVHVIDAVMLPPKTVVDVIVKSSVHNTLETAVIAAGLAPTLSGAGPFTIYAPTDKAFAALPAGTLQTLLANKPLLTSILTYHAVGTKILAADKTNGQVIKTINGKDVIVKFENGNVFINDSKVTITDILADNGVVHVIDAVLLPPNKLVNESETRSYKNTTEIYPNPFADFINVDVSQLTENIVNVRIYDISGKIVMNKEIDPVTKIDLNELNGTYIIQLSNGDFNLSKKIISNR